jgi:O-glycosyl hydrolase
VIDASAMGKARRVVIGRSSNETNVTQLTMQNVVPVQSGDTLMASFWLRGPGKVEFLFEKSTDPWTKSVTRAVTVGAAWKQFFVPFRSAQSYQPGEAMASLRLAFGPQTIDIAKFQLQNFRNSKTVDELTLFATKNNPIGHVTVDFDFSKTRQTMMGFGGNFCQPRYGSSQAMDLVGEYNLKHLNVVHARVGLPLNHWTPQRGEYKDEGPAHASLQALQILAKRRIPLVVSIWEGPQWMLGGRAEQSGRVLPRELYGECIDAITRYLVRARDVYGASVGYLSFNEADYGVNFKFSSAQIGDFIRQAGPRFAAAGLKTKFLVADTANGSNLYNYARPLLEDRTIAAYLGPIAFHNWDALSASDESYRKIAELGRMYKKPVWCLEAGHDAQLWQNPNDPWKTWDNALQLAMSYERTLRLTQATLMDYWTYQDNYPLVEKSGRPYPVFSVVKQMEEVFAPGTKVVLGQGGVQALATTGKGLRVLLVNPEGPGSVTLRGLPKNRPVRIVLSEATRQRTLTLTKTDGNGRLSFALPMRSVVSVLPR